MIDERDNLEEWRPVVGYEGAYEVSSLGRVRCMRLGHGKHHVPWLCKFYRDPDGYLALGIGNPGARRHIRRVHRLVLNSFVGPRPDKMEACHNNGDQLDNRAANLRWDTHRNNYWDAEKHGTRTSKVTAADIPMIRALKKCMPLKEVAKHYGITYWQVNGIQSRRSWRHIP